MCVPGKLEIHSGCCAFVQPAPATNSSFALGRMVWRSLGGATMPSMRVRVAGGATVLGLAGLIVTLRRRERRD